jgi:phospholipase/lecithinase/hemolysin
MASRRQWHLSFLSAVVGAALLAACGGSNEPVVETPTGSGPAGAPTTLGTFTRLISFGDSLSDLGTYAPATSLAGNGTPPYFGGRFTTNAYNTYASTSQQSTATMWPEVVAAALSLVITPAEVGFAGQSVKCPVAAAVPALAGTCTGYGQGGARVTNPIGLGNDGKNGAALTVPLVTQVANHLARFGNFTANDLVFVWGGSNDVLYQHGAYMQIAGLVAADLAAGRITQAQADSNIAAARAGALTEMKNVARQLAALVRDNIVGKGAKYVAVMNIADISGTPYGGSLSADNKAVLQAMSIEFDNWIVDALTGLPVQIYDSRSGFAGITSAPANYGIVNVTVPACDAAKISPITGGKVTDGSSLFCNVTPGVPFNGLRTGADFNTWLFADGVHPTTGGHRALGGAVLANLRAWGWIAP